MSSTISKIRLNCFVQEETEKDIFPVVIDKNLTVDDLKDKIKDTRQDLQEINFDLCKKDFAQDNFALVSTVNSVEKKTRGIDGSAKKISQYFSAGDILQDPYLPVDGKKGPINIIIYPEVVLKKEPENIGL